MLNVYVLFQRNMYTLQALPKLHQKKIVLFILFQLLHQVRGS